MGKRKQTSKQSQQSKTNMKLLSALLLLCQHSVATSQWVQVGNDIDGEVAGDWAGGAQKGLSLSGAGTTIAVGSSGHDHNGVANVGHVRIFDLDLEEGGGLWWQRGAAIAGELANDNFGASVVLSEDGMVVAIGAPNSEAGNTGRYDKDYGQARIFEWNGNAKGRGEWTQRGSPIIGEANCDFLSSFGGLAMNAKGNTVVVGAATHDGSGSRNQGQARVFDWDGSDWIQQGEDLLGKEKGDWFGASMDINGAGDTVAIGSLFDNGAGVRQGSVGIYVRSVGGDWLQLGDDIIGEEDYDFSGSSLAINDAGDVVVGSPQANAPFGSSKRGAVTVYEFNPIEEGWQKRGSRIEGEKNGDQFGSSVVISNSGDSIAAGAYLNDGTSDTEGQVRVYDWDGNSWSQRGDDIDGENQFDYSGYSVSISADGNIVASGARFTDDGAGQNAGHARIFEWTGESPEACEDDPDFRKGRKRKNCEDFLRRKTVRRCNRNHKGGKVLDFCKRTCGEAAVEVGCDAFDFVLD